MDSPDATLVRFQNEKIGAFTRRRQRIFENNSAPIVNYIAGVLFAQWPCQIPQTPNLTALSNASAYIDINRVMTMAKPKFKAWFDNLEFYRYLERIGRVVTTLPVTTIPVPTMSPVCPSQTQHTITHVKQQDLFSGEGPSVHDDTTSTIGTEWLDLRAGSGGSKIRLQTLVDKLETSAAGSQYEKAYVAGLKDSALQLQMSTI
ncbi:hypothetical protein LTR75_018284, partial [Friedmanniomyces endolithicus]